MRLRLSERARQERHRNSRVLESAKIAPEHGLVSVRHTGHAAYRRVAARRACHYAPTSPDRAV
jgi:hypothetical protein